MIATACGPLAQGARCSVERWRWIECDGRQGAAIRITPERIYSLAELVAIAASNERRMAR